MTDRPWEWNLAIPVEELCGSCDGKDAPVADCEECHGTGRWQPSIEGHKDGDGRSFHGLTAQPPVLTHRGRINYADLGRQMKDALAEVRNIMENSTDWSGMQITITYPGSTTVDVQIADGHEHCVEVEEVCAIDRRHDDHPSICCTCRLPLNA